MSTTIKERPILFSGAMVRALLAGTKTQTRREAKHPLAQAAAQILSYNGQTEFDCVLPDGSGGIILCPYGQPGDRLWVRETLYWDECGEEWCYQAGNEPVMSEEYTGILAKQKRAIPSIHMPRAASRLLLEITSVCVERVQAISEADAVAEGYSGFKDFYDLLHADDKEACDLMNEDVDDYAKRKGINYPIEWYKMLWQKINGPDSWAANPWVWVVEFKVLEGKEQARG